jgi:hypothetical protein
MTMMTAKTLEWKAKKKSKNNDGKELEKADGEK